MNLAGQPRALPAAEPHDALQERLSFLCHRINARIAMIGNQHFRKHRLNHFSARILVLLLERKQLRTGELVELLHLPQSTISTQLLALHKRKLISRRRSTQDNRSVIVTLTPAGHAVAADCDALSVRVQDELEGLFSPSDMKKGYAFLRRMDQRLGELEGLDLYPFRD